MDVAPRSRFRYWQWLLLVALLVLALACLLLYVVVTAPPGGIWSAIEPFVRAAVAILIAYARRLRGGARQYPLRAPHARLHAGPPGAQPHRSAGLFQSVADAVKMMGKEDFAPTKADKVLFTLAPLMVMIGAVAVQLVIPYTKGWTGQDLNVGLIYLVAITSFTVLSILVGGWASHNKYSLVGSAARGRPDGLVRDPDDPRAARRRRDRGVVEPQRRGRLAGALPLARASTRLSPSSSSTSPRSPS